MNPGTRPLKPPLRCTAPRYAICPSASANSRKDHIDGLQWENFTTKERSWLFQKAAAVPRSSSSPSGSASDWLSLHSAARRLKTALFSASNLLPLLAAVLYLVNRFVVPLDTALPPAFARYHLGDLCGGVLFPAYVNVLTRTVAGKNLITDLKSALLLAAICSLCWEFVTPRIFGYGTADYIDDCMYFLGCLIYLAGFKLSVRT